MKESYSPYSVYLRDGSRVSFGLFDTELLDIMKSPETIAKMREEQDKISDRVIDTYLQK